MAETPPEPAPEAPPPPVVVERDGVVTTIIIDRPRQRNAVDRPTADALHQAFVDFEADPEARVAVLAGAGGTFCAGADLQAVGSGDAARMNRVAWPGPGPMGPTRLALDKPVIAAIDGHAVAGGLELALWCDLRVVERSAIMGVFCRRWGVPLIDGGTVRLPRIVGLGRALDLILTGRAIGAEEALTIGLATRIVDDGRARLEAQARARELAALPQRCLRSDRRSVYAGLGEPIEAALERELGFGMGTLASGESATGARRFAAGAGRHGAPDGQEA
ncbi:MAG: crotonase/enoyl-CoA hydratase family protein [Deltaproteobacteria bacterium]|nr:crotonase/enoyl-CoA hydratase family protein [Deltaproteobacteria bacterium]